jgi:hypothetical protein
MLPDRYNGAARFEHHVNVDKTGRFVMNILLDKSAPPFDAVIFDLE